MVKSLLSRRRLLRLGTGAFVGLGFPLLARASYQSYRIQQLDDPTRTFAVANPEPTLKQRAAAKNLLFGSATDSHLLAADPAFAQRWVEECALLVPENDLKWRKLRPSPDQFDFTAGDNLLRFVQQHDLQMRGHTLLWHLSMPDWFSEVVNRQNAEQVLVNHIETVVKHYAGQMQSWDVVNEAIEPKDGRADRMRRQPWLDLLGPDYVDLAYRVAATADPNALLVYNDFGLEYDTPDNETKRQGVLKLLERLKAKGTPLHAFGLQSHLAGDEHRFKPEVLRRFLADVASLGLKIYVTELDVIDQALPRDLQVRDRMVASVYEDFLVTVLDEPAVQAILTWGLSDRYSWLAEFYPRSDGLPVRPLPLDQDLQRKPAWNAIARAIDQTTPR
jgi:endo-1,4-beta-xylanase